MDRYTTLLISSGLFKGVQEACLPALLSSLNAKRCCVYKDSFVLTAGDKVESVGIVLEGTLRVIRESQEGEREVLTDLNPGDIFAETLCCAGFTESPVSVIANTEACVLLLPFIRILDSCPHACEHRAQLTHNMLNILASKNLLLQRRMELLSKKSMRLRLVHYLKSLSPAKGSVFQIPFNREELADYLGTDRSALSRELGKMKKEGLIDFNKNQFTLTPQSQQKI